jgi:ribosomal protein L37AE/L43A
MSRARVIIKRDEHLEAFKREEHQLTCSSCKSLCAVWEFERDTGFLSDEDHPENIWECPNCHNTNMK